MDDTPDGRAGVSQTVTVLLSFARTPEAEAKLGRTMCLQQLSLGSASGYETVYELDCLGSDKNVCVCVWKALDKFLYTQHTSWGLDFTPERCHHREAI